MLTSPYRCFNCLRMHGSVALSDDDIAGESSSYCGNPATTPYASFRLSYEASLISTKTAQTSDQLGTRTAISLYWTDNANQKVVNELSGAGNKPTPTETSISPATSTGAASVGRYNKGLLGAAAVGMVMFA